MSVRRALCWLLCGLTLLAGVEACSRTDEAGVVARVNGRPIHLDLLEFAYEMRRVEGLSGTMPTVGALRAAYGEVLGSLIAEELVAQDLEKRGQGVTKAELAEAEAVVRADYPGDTFDRMLADELIDLRLWREQLRYACGVRKFQRLVLRPSVHVDYREAEAYYRAHVDEFRLPDRVRVLLVRALRRDMVDAALAAYHGGRPRAGAAVKAASGVRTRVVTAPEGTLPPAWAEALRGREAGQGVVLPGGGGTGFLGLLVLGRLPAGTLSAVQAYPRIEAALLGRKMQRAFDAWLEKAVGDSHILVSRRLLHKAAGEDSPSGLRNPAPEGGAARPDVASGNETG